MKLIELILQSILTGLKILAPVVLAILVKFFTFKLAKVNIPYSDVPEIGICIDIYYKKVISRVFRKYILLSLVILSSFLAPHLVTISLFHQGVMSVEEYLEKLCLISAFFTGPMGIVSAVINSYFLIKVIYEIEEAYVNKVKIGNQESLLKKLSDAFLFSLIATVDIITVILAELLTMIIFIISPRTDYNYNLVASLIISMFWIASAVLYYVTVIHRYRTITFWSTLFYNNLCKEKMKVEVTLQDDTELTGKLHLLMNSDIIVIEESNQENTAIKVSDIKIIKVELQKNPY